MTNKTNKQKVVQVEIRYRVPGEGLERSTAFQGRRADKRARAFVAELLAKRSSARVRWTRWEEEVSP